MLSWILGVGVCLGVGCEKQGKRAPAGDEHAVVQGASRPAPTIVHAGTPALKPACFDVYAGCAPTIGLPAVSPDGMRVAVPDFGVVSARDEFMLTMRIVNVDDGAVIVESPIITSDDYLRADGPELSEAQRKAAGDRAREFESILMRDRFVPLTRMGRVHEQRVSDEVDGMRAIFDGSELTIVATQTRRTLWQRSIATSSGDCGSLPIAEIAVWASRAHGVAVARVGHMSPDWCEQPDSYLIWR